MMNNDFIEQLKEWRHYLHSCPETAFEEANTAAFLCKELKAMGLDVHTGIGGTGIVANLTVGDGEKVIGLRSDIDSINLNEKNEISYVSKNPDKMHACGHDGHMTMLLGAAKFLSEHKDFNGTVRFVFQPAEEPGKGAPAMIDDGLFEQFPMDQIYGIHNMPQYPVGQILTREGGIMASEDNFVIRIKGKGGHASAPHLGIDPLVIAAEIIMALQTIASRNANPTDTCVVSCTEFETDGSHNAIPSNVEIKGDTRSFTAEMQGLIEERMRKICEGICEMHGAGCEFEYTHEFSPTINEKACTEIAIQAAKKAVGEENVNENCEPLMGSEDFAKFAEKIPGNFAFLGTKAKGSETVPLHNSLYDFNDDALEFGVMYWIELVKTCLS